MNPLWNSKTLDDKGSAMEDFCRSLGLTVCNVALHNLSHCPTNTSFPDITLAGDYANISQWRFLDIPSLSDHPYISFVLSVSNQTNVHSRSRDTPKPFPRVSACSSEVFLPLLIDELADLPVLEPSNLISSTSIDHYLANFMKLLHS